MRFTSAFAVLAVGCAAAGFPKRDLAEVSGAVTKVLDGLKAYDGEINSFNGGDPRRLLGATATMSSTVSTALDGLKAAGNVSISEAIKFKPLSDQMNAAGDAV